jgi:hypothetical protein
MVQSLGGEMRVPKHELSVVLDEDLKAVLAKMGLLQSLEDGQTSCCRCGGPLTIRNLQFVLPAAGDKAVFVCDSAACVESYLLAPTVERK